MTKASHLSLVPPPLAEKELLIDCDALHEGIRTFEEMAVKRGYDVSSWRTGYEARPRPNGRYVDPVAAATFQCFMAGWSAAWMHFVHSPAPAPAPALHVVPVPGSDLV
jgi:hypothetical protein